MEWRGGRPRLGPRGVGVPPGRPRSTPPTTTRNHSGCTKHGGPPRGGRGSPAPCAGPADAVRTSGSRGVQRPLGSDQVPTPPPPPATAAARDAGGSAAEVPHQQRGPASGCSSGRARAAGGCRNQARGPVNTPPSLPSLPGSRGRGTHVDASKGLTLGDGGADVQRSRQGEASPGIKPFAFSKALKADKLIHCFIHYHWPKKIFCMIVTTGFYIL